MQPLKLSFCESYMMLRWEWAWYWLQALRLSFSQWALAKSRCRRLAAGSLVRIWARGADSQVKRWTLARSNCRTIAEIPARWAIVPEVFYHRDFCGLIPLFCLWNKCLQISRARKTLHWVEGQTKLQIERNQKHAEDIFSISEACTPCFGDARLNVLLCLWSISEQYEPKHGVTELAFIPGRHADGTL